MVEEEGRQMAAENGNQRGKAQKAAPERRKGTFYLMLASWWPTTKGRKRLTRKGCASAYKPSKSRNSAQLSARQRTGTHGMR